MNIEEQLQIVSDNLIGLWRFHVKGRRPKWCATYRIGEHYYDIDGCDTVGAALARVIKQVKRGRKKK